MMQQILYKIKNNNLLHNLSLLATAILFWMMSIYYAGFLIWIAFVPVLYLNHSSKFSKSLVNSALFSAVSLLLTFYWLIYYNSNALILGMILYSSFFIFFLSLSKIFTKVIKYPWNILSIPLSWSMLQLIYSFSILGNYWTNLSVLQPMLAPLVWIITGYGITFLILLVNSLVFFYFVKKDTKLIIFGGVLILMLVSCFFYSYYSIPSGKNLRVALIQGNFPEDWSWRINNSGGEIFQRYKQLTLEAAKKNPDIIIWPEYAIPSDLNKNNQLFNKLSELSKQSNSYLIFGSFEEIDYNNRSGEYKKDVAIVFSNNGSYIGKYESVKPNPLDWDIVAGQKHETINLGNIKLGISMCYEETQRDLNINHRKEGAKLLVSLANNQVFKNSVGLKLASLYTRLTAAENKMYVIRATNTGITQIINPYGKITAILKPNEPGFLISEVYI